MTRRLGFTLLEVVLAVGLLAIGASAVLGLLSFGAAVTAEAELRVEAAGALPAVVADLEERLFPIDARGRAGEPVAIEDRPVPGHDRLLYSAVPVRDPDAGPGPALYRVDVDIHWSQTGQRRGLQHRILLPQQVPFGELLRRQFVEGSWSPGQAEDPAADPDRSETSAPAPDRQP